MTRPPPDPDLVDRIFEFLSSDRRLPPMDAKTLHAIKRDVRAEFRGEQVYVAARPATARQEMVTSVLALFNGGNATTIARTLGVGRSTVYRVLKQAGGRPHGPLYRVPAEDRPTFAGNGTAPPLPSDEA